MAAHIVFVRFFPGYRDSFPFDRIASLKDAEVGPALELVCKEWLRKPSNRREMKRQRAELRKRQQEWSQAGLARPSGSITPTRERPSVNHTQTDDVIDAAGWRALSYDSPELIYGISRRCALARFDTRGLGETTCEVLLARVRDVANDALSKTRLDELFASANPRFFVVAEADLSPAEKIKTHAQLARLCEPAGNSAPLEEHILRHYLPEIRGTLETIRKSERPDQSSRGKHTENANQPDARPNKGGRPSNDDSPSKKKQRWCYEQYMDTTKKLSRILEAARRTFGDKAPTTEGQIITYAQRWAKHKGLPIPRRN